MRIAAIRSAKSTARTLIVMVRIASPPWFRAR
jgi:hypothetical protein